MRGATDSTLSREQQPLQRALRLRHDRDVNVELALSQINIVVSDMAKTLAFYRRFGWSIETPTDDHAVADLANGMSVAFDSRGFVPTWDSGYRGGTGGTTVLGVRVPTRSSVDELYTELITAGYHGRQLPYDAFWGSRYAIVEDPDANPVGLMSPSD